MVHWKNYLYLFQVYSQLCSLTAAVWEMKSNKGLMSHLCDISGMREATDSGDGCAVCKSEKESVKERIYVLD